VHVGVSTDSTQVLNIDSLASSSEIIYGANVHVGVSTDSTQVLNIDSLASTSETI